MVNALESLVKKSPQNQVDLLLSLPSVLRIFSTLFSLSVIGFSKYRTVGCIIISNTRACHFPEGVLSVMHTSFACFFAQSEHSAVHCVLQNSSQYWLKQGCFVVSDHQLLFCFHSQFITVSAGSPSRGGGVVVCVEDKPNQACPLLFIQFLYLFLSLCPFQLYFIP